METQMFDEAIKTIYMVAGASAVGFLLVIVNRWMNYKKEIAKIENQTTEEKIEVIKNETHSKINSMSIADLVESAREIADSIRRRK